MSYDIYLYKSKSGIPNEDEADAVVAADLDKWAKKDINPQVKLSIVKALIEFNPRLHASDFVYGDITKLSAKIIEEEKGKFDHIEINSLDGTAVVRIIVYNNHVFITTPYAHTGSDAQQLFKDIESYVRIIRETAGYFVSDPQTGENFDPARNGFDGLQKYLEVSEHLDEIINPSANKGSSGLLQVSNKPWWRFW